MQKVFLLLFVSINRFGRKMQYVINDVIIKLNKTLLEFTVKCIK